jgi:predicted nucleic acid-binding protein
VARVIEPASIRRTVTRDPDDDAVLACALAARADLIISGDAHLLNLKSYQRMPIVSTAEALARISKATAGN